MEPVRPSSVPAVRRKWAADARAFAAAGVVLIAVTVAGTAFFPPFGILVLALGVLLCMVHWQGEAARNLHRMVIGVWPVAHRDRSPVLWDAAHECAAAAGMPVPRLYLLGPTVRAQAVSWGTGDNASIGVQESLVVRLPAPWVKAAVAHEIAHLRMGDIALSTALVIVRIWARWTSSALMMLGILMLVTGLGGGMVLVCGLAGWLASLAIGIYVMPSVRFAREYAADALGVAITGDPMAAVGLMMLFASLSRDMNADPRPRVGQTHPPPLIRIQAIVEANIDTFFRRP